MANPKMQDAVLKLNDLVEALEVAGKKETAKVVVLLILTSFVDGVALESFLLPSIKDWLFKNVDLRIDENGNIHIDQMWPDLFD
jgi:hypothetical protein